VLAELDLAGDLGQGAGVDDRGPELGQPASEKSG
jgi:hypothetical protein